MIFFSGQRTDRLLKCLVVIELLNHTDLECEVGFTGAENDTSRQMLTLRGLGRGTASECS